MNKIIEVKLTLDESDNWTVTTRKQFAPENCGGEQTFTESAGTNVHHALDVARGMVTWSPATITV